MFPTEKGNDWTWCVACIEEDGATDGSWYVALDGTAGAIGIGARKTGRAFGGINTGGAPKHLLALFPSILGACLFLSSGCREGPLLPGGLIKGTSHCRIQGSAKDAIY